jgi:hypothetical protein
MISLIELLKTILLEEKSKRDRCLRIADRKFDKPSAYKSGAVVRCRQGDIWKNLKESNGNSKIDAINDLFKSNSELASIGTPEQYAKYLDTIFPNSKVKDIVYHESPNKIEKFRNQMFGIYFSYSPIKNTYGGITNSAIIDVKNPLEIPKSRDDYELYDKEYRNYNNYTTSPEGYHMYKYDASIEPSSVTKEGIQIRVRTPEQIHILGSKQDIEGFKKFTGKLNEEKESLHKWFKRSGPKGKEGGWVDCNAPDGEGGYKACGRKKGEKRAQYPSCRPTASQCKSPGKGKKWGKTK